jgi:translation initiation factor 2 beta subunit (eIF-2beta)/eIF-5
MKYLAHILEKEFKQDWFEQNKKNYLVKNIEELEMDKNNPKRYAYTIAMNKNTSDLKSIANNIDYNDIIINEIKASDGYDYICSHPLINNGNSFITFGIHNKKDISSDDSFNRIHVRKSPPTYLTGLGLGYKAYKRVIKEVGFARSSEHRTNLNSRKIWGNLIKDPDFYAMTYLKKEETYKYSRKKEGAMVFHKEMNPDEIKKVIKEFSNPRWVKITDYCDPLKKLLNIQ